MKPRITVVTLGVDDLERAVRFYTEHQAGKGNLLGRLRGLLSGSGPVPLGGRLESAVAAVIAPRHSRSLRARRP